MPRQIRRLLTDVAPHSAADDPVEQVRAAGRALAGVTAANIARLIDESAFCETDRKATAVALASILAGGRLH